MILLTIDLMNDRTEQCACVACEFETTRPVMLENHMENKHKKKDEISQTAFVKCEKCF